MTNPLGSKFRGVVVDDVDDDVGVVEVVVVDVVGGAVDTSVVRIGAVLVGAATVEVDCPVGAASSGGRASDELLHAVATIRPATARATAR